MADYIANALSLGMLATDASIRVQRIEATEASDLIVQRSTQSVVGHADTAALFEGELGLPVMFHRATVTLNVGDTLVVGQYKGPRLPEGTSVLPEGASIQWLDVRIEALS